MVTIFKMAAMRQFPVLVSQQNYCLLAVSPVAVINILNKFFHLVFDRPKLLVCLFAVCPLSYDIPHSCQSSPVIFK